jgi:hypothetical protein
MKRLILRWGKPAYDAYIQGERLESNGYYDFEGKYYTQEQSVFLSHFWNGRGNRFNKKYTSAGIYTFRIHPEKYGLVFTSKRIRPAAIRTLHYYKITDKQKFLLFSIKYPGLIFFNPMSK